jgi:predicted adenylyl cyclase CyaB
MPRKKEIETKFIVDDLDKIRSVLRAAEAVNFGSGSEENIYFENPGHNLWGQGKVLRLRKWRNWVVLTHKKFICNVGKISSRDEAEVSIERPWDFSILRRILLGSGLIEHLQYAKNRELWSLMETNVSLDEIEDGRMFVEVEGAKRNIRKVAKLLGLDWNEVEERSYPEIIKELRENNWMKIMTGK